MNDSDIHAILDDVVAEHGEGEVRAILLALRRIGRVECPRCHTFENTLNGSKVLPGGTTRRKYHRCHGCGHAFSRDSAVVEKTGQGG